jgi:hypothetical protein
VAVSVAASSVATRRGAVIALFVAIAAALGIAVFRPEMFTGGGPAGQTASDQIGKGFNSLQGLGNTVARLFEGRSPGERIAGALASLKHPRRAVLHQRALPKIRRPASPLAAIVGAPVVPPIAPPAQETPLFNVVNDVPTAPLLVAAALPPGGGAVIFPGFTPPPGGGGGGIIVPPVVTAPPPETPVTPVTPGTPGTPAVPEPTTWALMLMGFAMIGRAARTPRPVLAYRA